MSDMVCRKSMMRCQTPGMCSPHGGCRDELTTAKDRQISALIAESERLKNRLEVDPRHDYDGISTRDATVKVLDEQVDQLKAENEALRSQVATLQSDANSWQSGYDEGRRMGTNTALDEREQLRKDAERYRWLRVKQTFIWLIQDWFPKNNVLTDVDAEIDAAMGKGKAE